MGSIPTGARNDTLLLVLNTAVLAQYYNLSATGTFWLVLQAALET